MELGALLRSACGRCHLQLGSVLGDDYCMWSRNLGKGKISSPAHQQKENKGDKSVRHQQIPGFELYLANGKLGTAAGAHPRL